MHSNPERQIAFCLNLEFLKKRLVWDRQEIFEMNLSAINFNDKHINLDLNNLNLHYWQQKAKIGESIIFLLRIKPTSNILSIYGLCELTNVQL